VASTTGRSRIRKDHIRAILTLSHRNGDDGTESKKFQRTVRSMALVSCRPGRREKLTRRTRDGKEDEKEQ